MGTFQISRDIGPLISAAKERKKSREKAPGGRNKICFITYFSIYFTICSFLKIEAVALLGIFGGSEGEVVAH